MCLRQITLRYTLGAQLREDAAAAAAFPPAPPQSYPIHMQNATTLIGNWSIELSSQSSAMAY